VHYNDDHNDNNFIMWESGSIKYAQMSQMTSPLPRDVQERPAMMTINLELPEFFGLEQVF
jgi:hypothetical protein